MFGEGEIDVPLGVYDCLQQRLCPVQSAADVAIQTRFRNRANDSRAGVNGETGHLMTAEVTDPWLKPSMPFGMVAVDDIGCADGHC
ncbi:hypothetical protein ABIA14_006017 [Sinorhizobium fredii]